MRFIEPLGLLTGAEATAAVAEGLALPVAGGSAAFTLAKLIEGGKSVGIVAIGDVPDSWQSYLDNIVKPVCPRRFPEIMGIINVTPDSFSCEGAHYAADAAIEAASQMVEEGAHYLDIGGESTRPGAKEISPDEEWRRISPVIKALKQRFPHIILSVDTRHSRVMQKALDCGVDIINDVSALGFDPKAGDVVAASSCGVVLMHMRGVPQTMAKETHYGNVAYDVCVELQKNIEQAVRHGIKKDRILIDPGFGFAKTTSQNIELLRHVLLLTNLGCRIVCGISRKRFLGEITGESNPVARDLATNIASFAVMALGNPIMRVHNVKAMQQALTIWEALYSRKLN